uniref:Uncharacterized protein n=1 Tax=Opuntia streptacantha TaxID=393608 RepID=A0A7C9AF27_OPUST
MPLGPVLPAIQPFLDPPLPLSCPRFQPPSIIQFNSQHPPMELHSIKLHSLHGRLLRRRLIIDNKPIPQIPFQIIVPFYQNHIFNRPKSPEELRNFRFLHPQWQIPNKNLSHLSKFHFFGTFIFITRQILCNNFIRWRGWRRRWRRRGRGDFACEAELRCEVGRIDRYILGCIEEVFERIWRDFAGRRIGGFGGGGFKDFRAAEMGRELRRGGR